MTQQEQKKRKIMIGVMIILMLIVALRFSKKTVGSSDSFVDSITGGNTQRLVNSYKAAVSQRHIALQESLDFHQLEEALLARRSEFWSYSKTGSPRGDIQQHLRSLGKNANLDDLRVSIGFERVVTGCTYIKMIDFSVSSRTFDMKNLTEFMDLLDQEAVKYFWNDYKIHMSGKKLVFSGSIRIYVLTNKAVSLLRRKS